MLAPYAGYPNVAALIVPCEQVIGAWISEGEPAFNDQDPGEI